MAEPKLTMSFEANTIKHLGVQMYSTIPPALAEMIANAYDACAKEVRIKLYDQSEKKIVVEDNGEGMTFNEINDFFLRIGRNRREEGQVSNCKRVPTGKKGLGKLALFGIGDVIAISTIKDGENVEFEMDWNDILSWKRGPYEPKFNRKNSDELNGTTITLKGLKRKSNFSEFEYAVSLSKLFNFSDKDFKVTISLNGAPSISIDNKLKYESIIPEFTWNIKEIMGLNTKEYENSFEIEGEIITAEKPLSPGLRGITLFANGRMVNFPEFFGQSESSHFFSYTTGWLNVDFIDNWPEDVISTNRQSIDWDNEKTIPLREYLASLLLVAEREWRDKRRISKQKSIKMKTNIDVKKWYGTLPEDVQEKVETIVNLLDNTPELSQESQQNTIEKIHELIPEYPNLHWRHIHPEIRHVSEKYYVNKDFYTAFMEALKRYIAEVRKKSGSTNSNDRSMMGEVFSNRKLSVTKSYKKTDGTAFASDTIKNIEDGQHYLSEGIVIGGRNPLAHEEHRELSLTGLFSEKDCLDFLSLLSHLFKRLEKSDTP